MRATIQQIMGVAGILWAMNISASARNTVVVFYPGVYWDVIHYYRIGLCSKPFVPAAFGTGTIGGFCPGSNG